MKHLMPLLLEKEEITTQEYNKLKYSGLCKIERFNLNEINAISKSLSGFNFAQEKDEEEDQLKFWHKDIHDYFAIDKISQKGKVIWLVYHSKVFRSEVLKFDDFYLLVRYLSRNNIR